jgi:DNA polymerase-3 subunit epsilon
MCSCHESGRHYPGIAHLLKTDVKGLVPGLGPDEPWSDLPVAMLDLETTGL